MNKQAILDNLFQPESSSSPTKEDVLGNLFPVDASQEEGSWLRAGGAAVGGLAAFPLSGVMGLAKGFKESVKEQQKLPLEQILEREFGGSRKTMPKSMEVAGETIEQVSGLPSKYLIKSDKDADRLRLIMKPMEWVEHAGQFYGDKAFKAFPNNPDIAANVKTAFEIGAFLGLPKMVGRVRAGIKAGNYIATVKAIEGIHKARLEKIRAAKPKQVFDEGITNLKEPAKAPKDDIALVGEPKERPVAVPAAERPVIDILKEDGRLDIAKENYENYKIYQEKSLKNKDVLPFEEWLEHQKRAGPDDIALAVREPFELREAPKKELPQQIKDIGAIEKPKLPENVFSEKPAGGTELSFMGTKTLLDASKRVGRAILDSVSIEPKWKRMGAPEVGFALKNNYSMRAKWEESSIERAKKTFGKVPKEHMAEVVFSEENPARLLKLPPDVSKIVRDPSIKLDQYFKEMRREYIKRGVKPEALDFRGRVLNDLDSLIKEIESGDTGQLKTPAIKRQLAELYDVRKLAEQMNFAHIPSAIWFTDFAGKDPAGARSVLKLLATQKRKTFMIKDLVDRGVITKEQVHPVDIMASYGRRMGKDIALLDIVNAATKEKLAIRKTPNAVIPENYVDAPTNAPILKNWKIHPELFDQFHEMTNIIKRGGLSRGLDVAFTGVKMAQFYNPLFLPMYDVVQGTMLGSMRSLKTPKYLKQAIGDVWKKTPEYFEALENGLASTPFNNPFKSWRGMVESAKRSKGENFVNSLKQPAGYLKQIYNTSWSVAWAMDKTIRMASYRFLKEKGYAPREAAQIAAKFHADYASVPPNMRRSLNKLFFTPTFKIAMADLWANMLKGAAKAPLKMGKDRTLNIYGKGLIATAAINFGMDMYFESQGFKTDEFGRRYVKNVETDKGMEELVIVTSNPANMWSKYIGRAQKSFQENTELGGAIKDFANRNKWELHPIYRIAMDLVNNTESASNYPIVNPYEDRVIQGLEMAKYAALNAIPLIKEVLEQTGTVEGIRSEESARAVAKKEMGQLTEMMLRPFSFKYMRSIEEQRMMHKARREIKDIKKMLYDVISGKLKLNDRVIENIRDRFDNLSKEHSEPSKNYKSR